MNSNPPTPQDEENPLNLGKFAPGAPDAPTAPASEEGPTIFFRRAAADIARHSAQPVIAPKAGNAMAGKDLLGAVAYCYAKGVYSSAEIENEMLRDSGLRQATHEGIPDAQAIRRFRRMNRGAILESLERWYRKLRKSRPAHGVMPGALPPAASPIPPVAAGPGPAPDENTSMFVRREASDRVDKACFIDGMEQE